MNLRYEIRKSDKLGRYLIASKDLKAGETVLSESPLTIGPHGDSNLVCFNCYLPLISKFLVCKNCGIAPVCPGDGCPDELTKWHDYSECELFKNLKLSKGLSPMVMVQNVGSLIILRIILKKKSNPQSWQEFMSMETHFTQKRSNNILEYYDTTSKFIDLLGVLDEDDKILVHKVCAAVDVNSFEVRGPLIPGIGCCETLRGIYMRAALIAHDCVANTQMAINNSNMLVCHATNDIKKGETIYYNYSDPLKGTALRQYHLQIGKYFKCECRRCTDRSELGTHISSTICSNCKTGYVLQAYEDKWSCNLCEQEIEHSSAMSIVKTCGDKLGAINKKDAKKLEEYINNVSLILAPNHYLLLEAKQRLAGVLRDNINREPHPTKKVMRRKIDLCQEILQVLDILTPGISRTKAITLYELHVTVVQLAKKLFDGREINGSAYMDELVKAEKLLKRSLEMLFIEPGNSPEGELCAKALDEYRALKDMMGKVVDAIHAEGKCYVYESQKEELEIVSTI